MDTSRVAETQAQASSAAATHQMASEVASQVVEYRQVSLAVLARVQALQTELQAIEARIRLEQLQMIAADTGADLTHETWLIDLQTGILAKHEVVSSNDIPEESPPDVPAAKTRKPRRRRVPPGATPPEGA